MYYISYEGLKIESNEPVYCTYQYIFYKQRGFLFVCLVIDYIIHGESS